MRSFWSLRSSEWLRFFLLVLSSTSALAQLSEDKLERTAKSENYIFPIKPGVPASLAGTMGELRSSHFHSGIDIRTYNEIGWPVVAPKSGYIYKIRVEPGGFGNSIYMRHPDGNTTVYGHLEGFYKKLSDYVLTEQYRRKDFSVELYFRANQFSLNQGDTIGYTGNTGSSQGPHLHFDIRDSKMDALDPLSFGFDEVKDSSPPIAQKIALKTLNIDSRINDQFGRYEFYLIRSGTNYRLNYPILASGKIGIELLGYDRMETYRYKMGINYIDMYVDDQLVFTQEIKKVDISETRSILALMDYETQYRRGTKFYKLYIDEGNRQDFYNKSPSDGAVWIDPSKDTNIKIVLKDIYGNSSEVTFRLKPTPSSKQVKALSPISKAKMDIQKNTLTITSKPCDGATVYVKGQAEKINPTYGNTVQDVYLIDLRKSLPDSIQVCNETIVTDFQTMIPSGSTYKFYSDWADITFPSRALFDTVYLQASHVITPDSVELFNIGNPLIPLSSYFSVSLNPVLDYPKNEQVAAYRKIGNYYSYSGGKWENGRLNFYTRYFGDYQILIDTIPPTISRVYVNSTVARFKIRDNLSGINSWEATIDGKWLLMTYDAKSATLHSKKLNNDEPLKGEFKLVVTDNAGNKETFSQTIY